MYFDHVTNTKCIQIKFLNILLIINYKYNRKAYKGFYGGWKIFKNKILIFKINLKLSKS